MSSLLCTFPHQICRSWPYFKCSLSSPLLALMFAEEERRSLFDTLRTHDLGACRGDFRKSSFGTVAEMGEDNKDEEKKKEESKEEKEEEKQTEIVFKVDMHCEACARKVARALRGFQGVEDVTTDSKANRVVVRGKSADPTKVYERLQKKSGRRVEIISPLPNPPEPELDGGKKEEEKKKGETKKEEPPAAVTVVLKVQMHCEACAQVLKKRIRKIKGVESVETDLSKNEVVVKGVVEAAMLVEYVLKRTGKQASVVKNEEKKEEEKKEEGKKEEEKKREEEGKEEDEKKSDEVKKSEYWPSKYYSDHAYAYPPQIFSDENPNACSVM